MYYNPAVAGTLQHVFALVAPEVILVASACVLLIGSTIRGGRRVWGGLALAAIAVALVTSAPPDLSRVVASVSPIWPDHLASFVRLVSLIGAAILVLLTWGEASDALAGEYFACILFIAAGTNLSAAANDLITLFLALELVSIPTYVLLYLVRRDRPAQEAAVKYFLLSVFSSALVLFGFSYLYGQTGVTNLPALQAALAQAGESHLPVLALVAIVFVVCGLGFRITAVPFHFYAPDVYEGTSTGAAALLAFVPKLAGFAVLIRLLGFVGPGGNEPTLAVDFHVPLLFLILAVITMTLGNVVALWQNNLQRILAYSSIAHAGYMLIGLTTAPVLYLIGGTAAPGGIPAVLFYLVAYGAMTLGAFGVIALLNSTGRQVENVDDLAGLSHTHPGLALTMSVFLFSLIGLPLTAGFAGKFMLFFGALEPAPALYRALALIAVLNAAIGAYYYLRIVGVMYLRGALHPLERPRSIAGRLSIAACLVLTIAFGIYPDPLQRLTQAAVTTMQR